jgi:hypothetical protein
MYLLTMTLTLNQFLLLIIAFAAVVAVCFLIVLFIQLRRTAKEGEKTLVSIRELAQNLDRTNQQVQDRIDEASDVLKSAKDTASNLAQATLFITTRMVKPSSKYLPFLLPLIRFVWRHWRKGKNKKEVENV